MSTCIYTSSGASGGGAASITIESVPGGSVLVNAAMQAAISQASHGSSNTQAVSGIGDTAFKVVNASDATVAFAKGGSFVVLGAGSTTRSGASMEADLETLAHTVAGQVS